ncbi:MAG: sulfotransferase domain-containing protein [Bacteroidetes bacterium]|nr:sulfotransferase domain-containing protein [Bacteroidota bacterium]
MQKVLPNFIIAGVHKAGTTSLFYYLSDHPQVLASLDKETNFFGYSKYYTPAHPLEEYYEQFAKYKNEKIVMEVSPGYFSGGKETAEEIKNKCNNPKILIILRDPVERVISFFNRKREVFQLSAELSLNEYYEQCQQYSEADLKLEKNHLYTGFEFGFYSKYMSEWYDVFGDNIKVMFLMI